MKVEVKGLKELRRDLKKAGGNADRLVTNAVTNSTSRIQQEVRGRALHRTGTLQRSVLVRNKGLNGEVSVNAKQGIFIEEGTKDHGPVRAKVLRFRIGGKLIYTQRVKGIKARPFFKPGVEASLSYVHKQFDKAADLIIGAMAGRA